MRHGAPSILCALAAAVVLLIAPTATADGKPDKPTAPTQIDETPPLIPIPGAHVTRTGLLVGGQPTTAQLVAIQQAGYRTVVSLRDPGEHGDEGEQAAAARLGMTFVSIPVRGAAGLTKENARKLSEALDRPDALPAVVHCATGQRSSALLGLAAFVVDRVSAEAAIELARSLGMKKFEGALRKKIAEICKTDESRRCEDVP